MNSTLTLPNPHGPQPPPDPRPQPPSPRPSRWNHAAIGFGAGCVLAVVGLLWLVRGMS